MAMCFTVFFCLTFLACVDLIVSVAVSASSATIQNDASLLLNWPPSRSSTNIELNDLSKTSSVSIEADGGVGTYGAALHQNSSTQKKMMSHQVLEDYFHKTAEVSNRTARTSKGRNLLRRQGSKLIFNRGVTLSQDVRWRDVKRLDFFDSPFFVAYAKLDGGRRRGGRRRRPGQRHRPQSQRHRRRRNRRRRRRPRNLVADKRYDGRHVIPPPDGFDP